MKINFNNYEKTIICFITMSLYSCTIIKLNKLNKLTQNNNTSMETFNIEKYNKEKDINGDIRYEDEDVETLQSLIDDYYFESIHHKNKYYSDIKRFYLNGNLKERGYQYTNLYSSMNIGIWKYYDEKGVLIRTEDKDKQYKVPYTEALKIAMMMYRYKQEDITIHNSNGAWDIRDNRKSRILSVNQTNGKYTEGPYTISGY
jgi:hypothetical protein